MIQWPQCPIEAETVIQHFTEAWASLTRNFQEAHERSISSLGKWRPWIGSRRMPEEMMNKKQIKEAIGLRADPDSRPVHEDSYRISKAVQWEPIEFVKRNI
jgi:hypothetical protein